MGIAERKIRRKEEVRLAILDAAWSLAIEDGWQNLSIRKIADAIEYSVPVIYDHFQNKEAILHEFTRRGFHTLSLEMESVKLQSEDPAVQLESMAYAYWNFAFENKEYYQLMYGLGMPTCEMVRNIDELHRFTNTIVSVIDRLIQSGSKPETDTFLKFHTFWSMIHGLISINMMNSVAKDDVLNQKILADFIQSFISSIKE